MKRRIFFLVGLFVVCTLVLAACGRAGSGGSGDAGSAGEKRPFSELREAARGTTVKFEMYGGDEAINAYVDDYMAPEAKNE